MRIELNINKKGIICISSLRGEERRSNLSNITVIAKKNDSLSRFIGKAIHSINRNKLLHYFRNDAKTDTDCFTTFAMMTTHFSTKINMN